MSNECTIITSPDEDEGHRTNQFKDAHVHNAPRLTTHNRISPRENGTLSCLCPKMTQHFFRGKNPVGKDGQRQEAPSLLSS